MVPVATVRLKNRMKATRAIPVRANGTTKKRVIFEHFLQLELPITKLSPISHSPHNNYTPSVASALLIDVIMKLNGVLATAATIIKWVVGNKKSTVVHCCIDVVLH